MMSLRLAAALAALIAAEAAFAQPVTRALTACAPAPIATRLGAPPPPTVTARPTATPRTVSPSDGVYLEGYEGKELTAGTVPRDLWLGWTFIQAFSTTHFEVCVYRRREGGERPCESAGTVKASEWIKYTARCDATHFVPPGGGIGTAAGFARDALREAAFLPLQWKVRACNTRFTPVACGPWSTPLDMTLIPPPDANTFAAAETASPTRFTFEWRWVDLPVGFVVPNLQNVSGRLCVNRGAPVCTHEGEDIDRIGDRANPFVVNVASGSTLAGATKKVALEHTRHDYWFEGSNVLWTAASCVRHQAPGGPDRRLCVYSRTNHWVRVPRR